MLRRRESLVEQPSANGASYFTFTTEKDFDFCENLSDKFVSISTY
jgi:hypothetical protein